MNIDTFGEGIARLMQLVIISVKGDAKMISSHFHEFGLPNS